MTSSKDPINNESMTLKDIVEFSNTPQQVSMINSLNSSTLNSNYSIPNLLSSLQNEWDAVMLENFKLRKQLDLFTKQLSSAFYERDAAKLVAAKLLKEKEDLSSELGRLTAHIGNSNLTDATISDSMDESNRAPVAEMNFGPLPTEFVEKLISESQEFVKLSKTNQDKFKLPNIKACTEEQSWDTKPIEKLTVVMNADYGNSYQKAVLYNGKLKVIYDLELIKDMGIQLSEDIRICYPTTNEKNIIYTNQNNEIFVYDVGSKNNQLINYSDFEDIILLRNHNSVVDEHFIWADSTGKIGFTSLDGKNTYIASEGIETRHSNYSLADLHKDGLLLALANEHEILVIDVSKPSETRIVFAVEKEIPDDQSKITKVQFSTNGYWMLVATEKNAMVFDLRKDPGTLAIEPFSISDLEFWDTDPSQKYFITLNQGEVTINTFKKATKTWETPMGNNNQFKLPKIPTDLQSFNVLCRNSKLTLILKSDKITSVLSTD